MPRRLLRSLLLALAVLAVAATAGPAQNSKATDKGPATVGVPPKLTHTVFISPKTKPDWSLFGVYASESSAKAVFNNLVGHGFDAKLEISTRPIPKVQPRPPTAGLPRSETITYKKSVEVFNWLARQSDIAFHFPVDGCYARAHLMCQRMMRNKFRPRKIWSFANGEALFARTRWNPKGYVTWGYHVAPVLRVRLDTSAKTQRWYVIDPALFSKPATVAQWEQAQMRTRVSHKPYLTITRIGEAPTGIDRKKKPGSGYWPGPDPPAGPDAHAVATMKKYKPWQGKEPPPTKSAVRRQPDALPGSFRFGWPRRAPGPLAA